MAFEADCGSLTVLEAVRVASTVRPTVSGECRAANSKFEIRNSKSSRGQVDPTSSIEHPESRWWAKNPKFGFVLPAFFSLRSVERLNAPLARAAYCDRCNEPLKPTTHVPWDSVCRRRGRGWRPGRRS